MEKTKLDIQYCAIRNSIIEQNFSSLNEMQKKAVMKTKGPLLILAGAGSGKTTVLINRILNILTFGEQTDFAPDGITNEDLMFITEYLTNQKPENKQKAFEICRANSVKPWEVIAITFTNKAAQELKDRLKQAIGEKSADVWAYTFHTACLRILRNHIEKIGYNKNFTIYDEDDRKKVITDILKDLNIDDNFISQKVVMKEISNAKDNLISPKQYEERVKGDYYKNQIFEIYKIYQQRLKNANALDFDDIIFKTVELLKNNEDIREYYQQKFKYIFVDEYQDTNHAQYIFTSLLAEKHKNICVVGDDDQSIYKFRGATIKNILDFEKKYKDAQTIKLEQNYRSTSNILSAANEIIKNNIYRKGKHLWTQNSKGEKICFHKSDNQEREADYIARTIIDGIEKGMKWSDFAVLYRNNALSNNIESAFRRNSIPYKVYRGRDFFSRAEIKDMFAYLWIIENPADTLRLKRIINVPSRKIGERSIEIAQQEADVQGVILYDIVKNAKNYKSIARSAAAMENFINIIEELRDYKDNFPISNLYDKMLEDTGYFEMLNSKGDFESKNRLENIMELKSTIIEYEKNVINPTLSGFLEDMALYTDADRVSENEDATLMMTMHSAKGLEFPVVFLCGMEEGLFPSTMSCSDDLIEEERRLCYVAVTRAKKELHITCTQQRLIYGKTQHVVPSRFINEIPENLFNSNVSKQSILKHELETQKKDEYIRKNYNFVKQAYKTSSNVNKNTKFEDLKQIVVGDKIKHRAFGEGIVINLKPMGGDILLEIEFVEKGIKRLLLKSAGQFIQKI